MAKQIHKLSTIEMVWNISGKLLRNQTTFRWLFT